MNPAQGSVIESVFASKMANQVAYRAAQKPQKQNVEMAEAPGAGVRASTRQRQLDYLRTLRFSSPNGDVNEDVIVRELLFVFQGIDG